MAKVSRNSHAFACDVAHASSQSIWEECRIIIPSNNAVHCLSFCAQHRQLDFDDT